MIHISMPEAGGHLLRYAKDIGTVYLMEQKQVGLPGKQLFTSWEHPEFNLKAVLRLEYEIVNGKWLDELTVRCRLQPKAK